MSRLDTKASIYKMTNSFLCKPIGKAMTNPLTLALMLTLAIMLIVVCSYDSEHIFRTVFRIFSVSTVFLFMNNHILMSDMECRKLTDDQNNILDIVTGKSLTDNVSYITPEVVPEEEDEEDK
jgi:hypothetical protein